VSSLARPYVECAQSLSIAGRVRNQNNNGVSLSYSALKSYSDFFRPRGQLQTARAGGTTHIWPGASAAGVGIALSTGGFFALAHRAAPYENAWLVLIGGLLLTGIAVAYISASGRYTRRLEAANKQLDLTLGSLNSVNDQLRAQNTRFDAALNNMTQGLCFFDGDQRLIVSNRRYVEMYGLDPNLVQPGVTLREIVDLRFEAGSFPAMSREHYMVWRTQIAISDTASDTVIELQNGRVFKIQHRPMPGGGWVATHEDITEQCKAEKALAQARADAERAVQETRAAHARLKEAFEVVPEALALFDAEDRYVLWNERYAEVYSNEFHKIEAGLKYEDAVRAGLAARQIPEAIGREEDWLKERLARRALPYNSLEQKLAGDRWVRIEERRTAEGGSIGIRIDITDLKRREASIRLLFKNNPLPMYVYDVETLRYLDVNDAAIEHYGYSREQFLTMTVLDMRAGEDREAIRQVARTARGHYRAQHSWRHRRADGSFFQAEVYARALSYEGHEASIAVVFDVTERRRADDEVKNAREFLNTIIDNVPMTITVKDTKDLSYVLVNRAAEKFLDMPREEIIGKRPHDLLPDGAAETMTMRDRELVAAGQPQLFFGERPLHAPINGPIINSKRILINDSQGKPNYILAVIEDVTEQKRAEERIAHMAHHDSLTDLPNRAAFNAHLQATLESADAGGQTFAVMCIDLDRFKEVNDVFGHAIGDGLLTEMSRRLREAAGGAFLARLGGDEFTLITTDGSPDEVQALTERLMACVADDIVIDRQTLRTGLSVGVAAYPTDGDDATTLLGNADAALYRAKSDGRGIIRFFDSSMDKFLRERRSLQHDLRSALERNEITLEYQPQALIGGEIIGFEALVRWHHPTRGMVSPSTFIPIAEESGLIIHLGEWILREACREAASWPRPLQIAVNLSPIQFQHGDLPSLVHTVLLETGLPANRLELEITEGVLIADFARGVSILRRLKALGVRIAMDDFGTGYSSLSYLQSFPFDKIKIDRAFISNLDQNAQSVAIVRAVIGLGRCLNLPVIAEGVETTSQREVLAQESCDEIQGYLVGRPMPISGYAEVVGRTAVKPPARLRAS
jgi:diguanylate cyclase (GGDEF)-like protein/PAS domain S-box-containing protein